MPCSTDPTATSEFANSPPTDDETEAGGTGARSTVASRPCAGILLGSPASGGGLRYLGRVRSRGRLLLALTTVAALSIASSAPATADTLLADPDLGYVPIEELSYETILRPGKGDDFQSELALRVALRNASVRPQDAIEALVLPRGAQLVGVAVNDGGDWIEADATHLGAELSTPPASTGFRVGVDGPDDDEPEGTGHRDPGTFWVHPLERENPGDLPAVEIVAYGMPSQTTVQVELRLRVSPVLRGGRWQLELPRRHAQIPNLADQRRVIVQGLGEGQQFWVDDVGSGTTPYMVTRSEDAVVVSWDASIASKTQLDGHFEVRPDPAGDSGDVRLVLRLGPSKRVKPDHVLLVVDRSQSGDVQLPKTSEAMFADLLDALPKDTTFDALTFAREAEPLLEADRFESGAAPLVRDRDARKALRQALANTTSAQGTDLRAAMALAGERLAARGAKRPLVVVVTDGMLPLSVGPDAVKSALDAGLGNAKRPELLFVVDDPLLNSRGLPADHPIASLAAGLGARLSLETVANVGPNQIPELLAAPRVLGELDLGLPSNVVLDDALPSGLVAGDFVVLEGTYTGRAPSKLDVRGRLGRSKVSATFKAKRRKSTEVLVVALREGDRERAAEEGLLMPRWYTASMRRATTKNIAQAGRVGWEATGQLDAAIVHRQLRTRVLPRARACYNRALSRNQVLAGRVELSMEFGKGEVMMASVSSSELNHPDPKLLSCLDAAAWAMDVPAGHLDTQVYRVQYPLEFVAPEGGNPPSTGEQDDPMFERLLESAEVLADYQNHLDD